MSVLKADCVIKSRYVLFLTKKCRLQSCFPKDNNRNIVSSEVIYFRMADVSKIGFSCRI